MRRSPLSSLVAALGVLALVATVAGCGGSDFDPATYLAPNKLRILATSAEPAEPKPGDQVTLTALVVDPAGSPMKDITVEWRRCTLTVNAAATTAVNQDCLTREDAEALTPLGTGHIITFTLPTIPQSQLSLPDGTFGIYTPIRVTVRAPGGRVLDGIYRLRVHPGQSPLPPNTNPTLAGLWFVPEASDRDMGTYSPGIPDASAGVPTGAVEIKDGTPFEMRNANGWTLRALFTDGSIETYLTATTDITGKVNLVEKSETPSVRWYTTAGNVETAVTGVEIADTNVLLDKFPPTSGQVVDVYAVGREERGGTTWLHRQLVYR